MGSCLPGKRVTIVLELDAPSSESFVSFQPPSHIALCQGPRLISSHPSYESCSSLNARDCRCNLPGLFFSDHNGWRSIFDICIPLHLRKDLGRTVAGRTSTCILVAPPLNNCLRSFLTEDVDSRIFGVEKRTVAVIT